MGGDCLATQGLSSGDASTSNTYEAGSEAPTEGLRGKELLSVVLGLTFIYLTVPGNWEGEEWCQVLEKWSREGQKDKKKQPLAPQPSSFADDSLQRSLPALEDSP